MLELIMTAPMVVANRINLQYYASLADPRSFGRGNKATQIVVGQIGILEGMGGERSQHMSRFRGIQQE